MQQKSLLIIASIFSIAIILSLPLYAEAQHPDFVPVSGEIKSKFDDRQKRIDQELSGLKGNEWAGMYFAQSGLIDGVVLNWSPSNGFTVRSGNSFHRGVERVNYGSANFNGKLLTVSPEYLEKDKHNYTIAASFIPVRWDKQHWLIPSDKLMLFIYAVNSGDYDEIHSFFLKEEDSKKSNDGLPDVPKEYRKYLNLKPIKAKVLDTKVNSSDTSDFTLTLNAGKAEGVIEGMKFYLINVKNVLVWIKVTDVREHASTADIVSVGSSADYDKEIKPEVGWEFTSKMPQDF